METWEYLKVIAAMSHPDRKLDGPFDALTLVRDIRMFAVEGLVAVGRKEYKTEHEANRAYAAQLEDFAKQHEADGNLTWEDYQLLQRANVN